MTLRGQNEFTSNKKSKVRIKVVNDACISAATCIIHAPETFDLDEDGIAYVKDTDWDEAAAIYQAAKSCPTSAIIIEDMDGNQLWPK